MPRSFSSGKLALAPIGLALILTMSACGGGDDPSPSAQPSSGKSSGTSGGGADNPAAPKGCKSILASGAVEDIAKLFDHYLKDPKASNAMDVPAMRKALEDLAKAADDAPPKVREGAINLVAHMGGVVDSHLGLEGVGTVASTTQIQKEIDSLCVPKG